MNYTFNDLMIAYIRGYIINNNIKVNENLIIKDINSLDSNERYWPDPANCDFSKL